MLYDDIKHFNKEFLWEPRIINPHGLEQFKKFVVAGMGGSHYAAILLQAWRPDIKLIAWANYGLPPLSPKDIKQSLIIASSYSGNTEEAIDSFKLACKKKLNLVVMASGGKLVTAAQALKLPYVMIPAGIQPRAALGYIVKAILKIMREKEALRDIRGLAGTLHAGRYEKKGKAFARKLKGFIPILYSSSRNYSVIWNWKVRFNETGKIPAFCNTIPEINHSEMIGFSAGGRFAFDESIHPTARKLSKNFYFIFLQDDSDHPRITQRMNMTRNLFVKHGFRTDVAPLHGKNFWEKMFSSIILADWTSYYIARQYHAEPEAIPMIEEFKKLMRPVRSRDRRVMFW